MLVPVVIRLSLFLIVPVIHWTIEKLIHASMHVKALKQFEHRWRHLPDLLMLLALIILHCLENNSE
jgi:hypothetical protein